MPSPSGSLWVAATAQSIAHIVSLSCCVTEAKQKLVRTCHGLRMSARQVVILLRYRDLTSSSPFPFRGQGKSQGIYANADLAETWCHLQPDKVNRELSWRGGGQLGDNGLDGGYQYRQADSLFEVFLIWSQTWCCPPGDLYTVRIRNGSQVSNHKLRLKYAPAKPLPPRQPLNLV